MFLVTLVWQVLPVESFSVENNNLIKNFAFFKDRPLNENNPNRNAYRLSHAHMKGIANQSTYFLATLVWASDRREEICLLCLR